MYSRTLLGVCGTCGCFLLPYRFAKSCFHSHWEWKSKLYASAETADIERTCTEVCWGWCKQIILEFYFKWIYKEMKLLNYYVQNDFRSMSWRISGGWKEVQVKLMKFYRKFLLANFSYRVVTDICKLLETSTVLERKIDFKVLNFWLFSRNRKYLLNTCAKKKNLDMNKTRNE